MQLMGLFFGNKQRFKIWYGNMRHEDEESEEGKYIGHG